MKANEFRVGNCINFSNRFRRIEIIHREGVYLNGDRFACYLYQDLQPIQLTPNILLKRCGFKYNKNFVDGEYWIIDGKMRINPKRTELWFLSNNGKAKLNYLHQLQNLYFSLTGEELSINLEAK